MTYTPYHWQVVMRYIETSSPSSTTDITLHYWVAGSTTAARQAAAEACAKEQCKNMLSGTSPDRSMTVVSSSQIGTRA